MNGGEEIETVRTWFPTDDGAADDWPTRHDETTTTHSWKELQNREKLWQTGNEGKIQHD